MNVKRTILVLSATAVALILVVAIVGAANKGRFGGRRLKTVAHATPAVDTHAAPPGVAAVVNDQQIPLSTVTDVALRLQGPAVLDQLIGDTLIHQEAERRNLTATDAEIDARVDKIRMMMQPKTLEDSLRAHHMSMADFRTEMQSGIEVRKLLSDRLQPVKMAHIRDLFVNISPFAGAAPSLHTAAQANRIISTVERKLKTGEPFDALAKQYGDDNIDGKDGGDLGIVTNFPNADQSPIARGFSGQASFLKACLSLRKGEIASPIKTRFGIHLLQAVSTADDPLPSDAPLYSAANDQAIDDQLARLAPKYVDTLKHAGKVTVYLGANKSGPAGVAATVNGEDIPLARVTEIAVNAAGASVVERMIDNMLVDQQAAKNQVTVTPAQIDSAINDVRRQSKLRNIDDVLRLGHMTIAELRETQKVKIEAEELVGQSVGPIKAAHLRGIGIMVKHDEHVKFGHTEAEAKTILANVLARLKSGGKFEDLAKRYSEDAGSKARGGDLGIVTEKDYFEPDFLKAALSLKKGEITAVPVKTSFEMYLLQAVSTSSDHPATEDGAYKAAEEIARNRAIQSGLPNFMRGLRTNSKVVDYLATS